jgi:hypothetical protein
MIVLFIFGFSISIFVLLISYFVLIFFIKVFFQFSSLITISRIYVFYSILIPLIFSPLITVFWFSISSFNKKNYCFIFFQFDRHYFNLFFIFVKAIFQFILTLQLKIFVCLLFFFHPHYFRSFCVIIFFYDFIF